MYTKSISLINLGMRRWQNVMNVTLFGSFIGEVGCSVLSMFVTASNMISFPHWAAEGCMPTLIACFLKFICIAPGKESYNFVSRIDFIE